MRKGKRYQMTFLPQQLAHFQIAINVFNELIELGNYNGYSIWNNRGILKLNLGIANKDQDLIYSAYRDFETAIHFTKENNPEEYDLAKENLALAQNAIEDYRDDFNQHPNSIAS